MWMRETGIGRRHVLCGIMSSTSYPTSFVPPPGSLGNLAPPPYVDVNVHANVLFHFHFLIVTGKRDIPGVERSHVVRK